MANFTLHVYMGRRPCLIERVAAELSDWDARIKSVTIRIDDPNQIVVFELHDWPGDEHPFQGDDIDALADRVQSFSFVTRVDVSLPLPDGHSADVLQFRPRGMAAA